jgi:hypothetical protein
VLAGVVVLAAVWAGCGAKRTPPPEPDATRAFADLRAQVDCGPRLPGSAGAACCRQYIRRALEPHAARIAEQVFALPDPYGNDTLRLVNVQANFHPERVARVLLAAHYDTRPFADRDTGSARTQPIPGANDGGSGVAVLLEIACSSTARTTAASRISSTTCWGRSTSCKRWARTGRGP